MQFNVAQLLREPVGSLRFYDLDEPDVRLGGEFPAQKITGQVRLLRTADGILVRAEADLVANQECSRCLTGFTLPLHVRFEEEFFPMVDVLTGAPSHLPPGTERSSFRISAHHILDIYEPLRQYAAIALPIQPLCRENCAGLCPTCGVDRNTTACDCEEAPVDPRWGSLGGLLQPNQERGA
jgi:uncharacterized protein